MTEQKPNWYVVRPTVHGDRRAADELKEADINHFMPTFKRFTLIKHTKGQRKETEMLLMPGYLFAQLSIEQTKTVNKHDRRFRHVASIVRAPGTDRALPVDEKAVEQLRYLCADGAFDQGKRPRSGFIHGDKVLIIGGPFDNITATFREGKVKPGFAKLVLSRMLGKDQTVLVPEDLIQAA
ncbi:transcription termination/antitermination protein NusG [Aminobacter aganoensis]|uniref:Transcription antitermination factor NusG n=1 Tax=Aminobacter aganoensis TaxID=83264 RepID=A0A7X0F5G7_9HYPH|nr:transcription termination/antitermination NusG family protein [Aminobacter aganoensis]MBB6353496.1 transcription antitermination factor NusG [Aminobacter aganoensis]